MTMTDPLALEGEFCGISVILKEEGGADVVIRYENPTPVFDWDDDDMEGKDGTQNS